MWLFTDIGFFSVVQKASDSEMVKVRSRIRADIENLIQLAAVYDVDLTLVETPNRDYPYRTFATKRQWGMLVHLLAEDVNYTNFKGHVAKRQGHARASLYAKVWGVMYDAEKKLPRDGDDHEQGRGREA